MRSKYRIYEGLQTELYSIMERMNRIQMELYGYGSGGMMGGGGFQGGYGGPMPGGGPGGSFNPPSGGR